MEWQQRAIELKKQKRGYERIFKQLKSEFPNDNLTNEKILAFLQEYKAKKILGKEENNDSLKMDLFKQKAIEITINKDGSQTSGTWVELYTKDRLKDKDFLLQLHGYDPKEFTVEWAKSTIWQNSSNKDGITDLYASKITIRKRTVDDGIRREDVMELFKEITNGMKLPVATRHKTKSKKLLEPNIMDLHYGKLAWAGETSENYDHKIAGKRLMLVADDMLSKTSHIEFEKAVVPFGNDYFNFNNQSGETEKGTLQDNDVRWQKCFVKGTQIFIEFIKKLVERCNVDILYVPGNHGSLLEFCATFAMYCYFLNDDRVNVDFSATARKYYEYGKCLIGYTHGDKEKNRLYEIMQTEAIEAWGRTIHHEWHTGHLHTESVVTRIGLKKRTVPSVTGTDAWHYLSGYVGILAQAQTFIWDKKDGLEHIIYSNVER